MTCTHPRIITYHDADTGQPVQLWACAECGHRFEPMQLDDTALLRQLQEQNTWLDAELAKDEALLRQALEFMNELLPATSEISAEHLSDPTLLRDLELRDAIMERLK